MTDQYSRSVNFAGGGTGEGGIVERVVGDVIFADLTALINWSNANLDQLRNNNDAITTTNPWNKSIAQVGTSPNQVVYQWDGDDQPSSFPTESAWTLRDRTLNASQIKTMYESNPDTNAFDDAEKTAVDSVQAAEVGVLLSATATGVRASGLKRMPDNRVMTETGFGVLGDGGIDIGPSVKLVDIGTQGGTRSAASQKRFASALVEYNRQTGWLDPTFSFNETAATGPETFDFQTVFTETITNPSFQLANTETRILDDLIFRAPDGVTNSNVVARLRSTAPGNPVIKYIPNEADWLAVSAGEYVDENGNQRGFTFTGQAGVDNTIDIHDSPVQTLVPSYASLTYVIDFVGNGDVQFLGDTNGVPYLRALGHAYDIKPLSSRINDLIGEASQYKVSTISQSSLLSYDPDNDLGPGVFARITNSNAVVEPSLTTEASQVGTAWIVFNDTSSDVTLRTQQIGGRNGRFRNSTQSGGSDETLSAGQTAIIVAEDANQTGDTFFNFTVIGRELQLTAGSNVTITGTYPNLTIASSGGSGGQVDSVVAGTNITVDNTDPANPVISSTAGGSTIQPRRITGNTQNVPNTDTDLTFYTIVTSGSSDVTINMFAGVSGGGEKRITFINNRPSVNGRAVFTFPSGSEPENLARQIAIDPGESISFYYSDDDRVSAYITSDIPLTPDFNRSLGNNDGSFRFSVTGSGTTAFNRDYPDTYINMENQNTSPTSVITYSMPPNSQSGLEDGRGYFIQNIGAGRAGIEPESGATLFVDGSARTGVVEIPVNQSIMVLWNSSAGRWDGTTFDRLLFSASGSGGSGAGAGGSSDEVMADSGVRVARNEGADVVAGDGISVRGIDGAQSFVDAGLGSLNFLNGFAKTDTAVNESTQYTYFGSVTPPEIYSGQNTTIGALLSVDDIVYWNSTDSQVWTVDESGAHLEVGRVLTSNWLFETTPFNADVDIDSQADWDAVVSKTHVKSGGNIHFDLPDTREGSSEATVIAGQQLIVHIPQGNGTAGIGIRGGELRPYPGETGSIYTPGNRLGMTGVLNAEYHLIEASTPGVFYYRALNTKGIRTAFHFSALDYARRVIEQTLYNHTVLIQTNTNAINVFKRNLVIPNVVDAIANPAGLGISNIDNGMQYKTQGGSVNLDRGWTISTNTSDWSSLQANMSIDILFLNNKLTTTAFIDVSSGNFFNGTGRIVMNGGDHKRIKVENTGGAIEVRDVT